MVIQLFESVIVQKYEPGPKLNIESEYKLSLLKEFVHRYVKFDVPVETLVKIVPSLAPLQLTLFAEITSCKGFASKTSKFIESWHPL